MSNKEVEMANQAMDRFQNLESFQGKQTVSAGQLSIEARIKFRKPRSLTLDYISYKDPYEEFAKEYSGGAEFLGEELEQCHLIYDGRYTLLHDRGRNTALKRKGKDLQDPFGEIDLFGQLGFLEDLTKDYLLKDKGKGNIDGKNVYRLGLKPKTDRRSLFLKTEVFDFDHAVMAIDVESGFPLKITFFPKETSSSTFGTRADRQLVVEYSDVRFDQVKKEVFKFDKKKVDQFFQTDLIAGEDYEEKIDFPIKISPAEEKGYGLIGNKFSLTRSRDKEKFYASLDFLRYENNGETPPDYLMLRFGNYLSREMSRHRSYVTGKGEEVELGSKNIRIADRGKAMKDKMPEELQQPTYEIGWEEKGHFFYLLSRGQEKEKVLSTAEEMFV